MSMKYRLVGEEVVEVPAGRFRAVRVEYSYTLPVGPRSVPVAYHATNWYAPGRGAVKVVFRVGEDETVMELKSYTPAGK
jgi:hypothetical protein